MLINKQGKIAYRGHPAYRPSLERDIEDLLNDKPLDVAPDENSVLYNINFAKVAREMSTLHLTLEGLMNLEEVQELTEDFSKVLCTIELRLSYSVKRDEFLGTY